MGASQVSLTSVQVSWHGLATRVECADQFIVKSWLARNPNDYKMSDLLQTTQYSFVVEDLLPNQDYVFQVNTENIRNKEGQFVQSRVSCLKR